MKIHISSNDEKERRMTIMLPTRVILSGVTATVAAGVSPKELHITGVQMRRLFKELRKAKKALGDLPFVEVLDHDGDYVRIDL